MQLELRSVLCLVRPGQAVNSAGKTVKYDKEVMFLKNFLSDVCIPYIIL